MKKLVILAAIAVAAGLASCKEHVPTPVFKTGVDSLSYAMGMARSQGLKPFLVARMNVDTTYMDEFQRGFLKYVDAVKAKDITYMAGMQIGSQIANQMIPGANNELFGPDSKKSIRMEDFIKGFEAGVMGQKTKMTMEQATEYYQYTLKSVRTERAALPDSSKKDISMTSAQLDSVSYAIGLSMTQDLKQYLVARENVDTTYMHDFVKGFKETVKGTSAREVALMAGMQIGNQVSNQIIPMANREVFGETTTDSLNRNNFIAGFLAGTTGINEKMSMAVAEEYTTTALSEIQTKALMAEFGANKAAGEAYMLENAKKGDVITTPSGLQYRIIQEGKGNVPAAGDMVMVHYQGTLIDGTEFDSSYARNEPATFRTTQVIQGWQEALTMMPVGSKWELVIPDSLAYGTRNQGQIKPFSTLIFEVELLGIEDQKK